MRAAADGKNVVTLAEISGRERRHLGERQRHPLDAALANIIAAVEAGRGIALVPSSLACIVGTRVKLIPLKPALPPISVGAVWRADESGKLAEQFVATAKSA